MLEGRRLHASDDNGFSDPYCKVTLGTATKKTAIIKKTLNPNWNHKMTFFVKNRQEKIVFEVFDWDLGKKGTKKQPHSLFHSRFAQMTSSGTCRSRSRLCSPTQR